MNTTDQPRRDHTWGRFRQVDEFLRLYQVGFVAVWPLLGLAAAQSWTIRSAAALVAASLCFNTFGGVLNDLCDLPSDREAPDRSQRWLVTGVVSQRLATATVAAQIPLLLCIHLAAGFRTVSLGWLVAALIGQAVYDVLGKRVRTPPLAEAGQALAAGCLVFYGATCAADVSSSLTWPTALTGAAALLLLNAFHGGLRDIDDDARSRVLTTPIWLGCAATAHGVRIAPAMSAYSACWLVVLVACSLVVAYEFGPVTLAVVSVECAINVALFILLHGLTKPMWDIALRANVALLMLPIMTAFSPLLGAEATMLLFVVYAAPVLPITWHFLRTATNERGAADSLRAA
jgi:4-hydroxybenzoate polyprenyltransferase